MPAFGILAHLILDYRADWIKLDFNLDPQAGCSRADHGHGEGDGLSVEAMLAVFRLAGGEEEWSISFPGLDREAVCHIREEDSGQAFENTGRELAKQGLAFAQDRNKKVVPHAFKTGVQVAASTHFAASLADGFLIEHTVSTSPLARNLVPEPIVFKDGYVEVPDRPGLGVTVDETVIAKYRVG